MVLTDTKTDMDMPPTLRADLGIASGLGEVPRIGLGAFPLSHEERPPEELSIRVLHRAWDEGVRLVDTADSYHLSTGQPGHGELLIRKALDSWGGDAASIRVSTKGGRVYREDRQRYCAGRPEQIIAACEASVKRLGVERIDLYYFHRPDPDVPYQESMGALLELCERGLISKAGISNASVDHISLARELLGEWLGAVQNQYSLWFRTSKAELAECERRGLVFVPWSPFGGAERAELLHGDPVLAEISGNHHASVHQVVLAWMLATSPNIVPIPGVRRLATLTDTVDSYQLALTPDEMTRLDSLQLSAPERRITAKLADLSASANIFRGEIRL